MHLANFNFAAPYWLLGLLLIPIGWMWQIYKHRKLSSNNTTLDQFIDPHLQKYILIKGKQHKQGYSFGMLYALLTACIILALANPRWNYTDLEAFQTTASMVVLLDLSATMNATDVSPSRIVRARQTIEDLLNLSKGLKIGLIGFAGKTHLISPITDDLQTIKTYIPALDTDLTNLQGDALDSSLRMAYDLLASEPGEQKSILLLSDGNFPSTQFAQQLKKLVDAGVQVHVMGFGTADGSPYKTYTGALQKSHGQVVISKLNRDTLQTIAKQGHGIYTELSLNNSGLQQILNKAQRVDIEQEAATGKVRQWEDRYYLFLIPAAALLLTMIRQRLVYLILITFTGLLPSQDCYASTVTDLFTNAEQKGLHAYTEADFKRAASSFADPYHKGVALYRDGQFAAAEEQFNSVQRPAVKMDAKYNAGNAQMQQKKWRAAIKSYEEVLAANPDNFAAQYNLEIAKKMLEEEPPEDDDPEEDKPDCDCKNKDKDKSSDDASADKQDDAQQDQQNQQDQKDQQQQQDAQDLNSQKNQDDLSAQAEQWLNRIDSDIKIFLKNKFYIEDVLSAK